MTEELTDAGEEGTALSANKVADADKVAEGAPEKYESFTLSEGMEFDQGAFDNFVPIAKELKLTQEQAQKLVTAHAEHTQHAIKAQDEAFAAQSADWLNTSKADPEIGGAKFDESVRHSIAFLDTFAAPEVRELLDATGLGNHPEIIRTFAKAGQLVSEDKLRLGGKPSEEQKNQADRLFPTHGKGVK